MYHWMNHWKIFNYCNLTIFWETAARARTRRDERSFLWYKSENTIDMAASKGSGSLDFKSFKKPTGFLKLIALVSTKMIDCSVDGFEKEQKQNFRFSSSSAFAWPGLASTETQYLSLLTTNGLSSRQHVASSSSCWFSSQLESWEKAWLSQW